tara:strand:+ start:2176 stop:2427 length:252 start_codon:yes stop_codon:yes gene_type:complete
MVIMMANANIRVRKWIDEILQEGDMEAYVILEKMKKMGHRNIPTMHQLANILAKTPRFIVVSESGTADKNGAIFPVCVWGLKK